MGGLLTCMSVLLCVYCALRLKDVSDALELEFQTIVSCLVGAGNQTTIPQNNSQVSEPSLQFKLASFQADGFLSP